jgi:endonuclease/exonuclease/phosphatase family metal-dependent hydrolase
VPAYKKASDWYRYWEWLNNAVDGDLAIGDFNADPGRPRKWDCVLKALTHHGGWSIAGVEGKASYFGNNGTRSLVDHALVRGRVGVVDARYIVDGIVPCHTDHAALLIDVART